MFFRPLNPAKGADCAVPNSPSRIVDGASATVIDEEQGLPNPKDAGAAARLEKFQKRLGNPLATPLRQVTNHDIGPVTPVGELEAIRSASKSVGSFTVHIFYRTKGTLDKSIGSHTFNMSMDTSQETVLEKAVAHADIDWTADPSHPISLKPDDCALRFKNNISIEPEATSLNLRSLYSFYANRPDKIHVTAANKLGLAKGTYLAFECVIDIKRYNDRVHRLKLQLYPEDDDIDSLVSSTVDAFARYARENSGSGLNEADQRSRLEAEFGLSIGKKVNADSVRKSKKRRTETETAQLVIDLKERDVAGGWGVTQVKGRLANEGVLVARDQLREILHDHFDEEFDGRVVGRKRVEQHRTPLQALGPWHQEHSDGHEKLAEQGLRMGDGIHLPIYASKDQFSAFLHALLLMPIVRDSNAIVHYYLDLVEDRGYRISIQITTDKGSEVIELHKVHALLRSEAAPEYTEPEFPAGVQQGSTKNTPIESFWRWLRDGDGHSVKKVLQDGSASGIFLPNDIVHRNVFYWLWVPIIQKGLDTYREYWNNHTVTKSKKKEEPEWLLP
ncbi:hypothetical protein MVEN_00593200 [Mycena venus]|uniref:Uncharacterized protein n=1 Tax=Mycena venus TaxID=2733690 RepID=A0A8H7D8A2_9AGAR|nr:hypothetical protein MVEN_00593200 [Mycena venus]